MLISSMANPTIKIRTEQNFLCFRLLSIRISCPKMAIKIAIGFKLQQKFAFGVEVEFAVIFFFAMLCLAKIIP